MTATAPADRPLDDIGLGRLQRVADPREVWPSEAGAFTPWLADNVDVLADELGVTLSVTATEVHVGDFRLDLKAETADGRVLIVENQLERTDHGHLGQLLVYASGLEAAIVVWVAANFRDDHRRALDWLNDRTDEGVSFFGVEVGIVQIADGPRAPVFEVVARPNDWQKQVKAAAGGGGVSAGASPLNSQRQDFFEEVVRQIALELPRVRRPSRGRANWLSFAGGPFGYWCISVTQDKRVRLEAYLDCGERDRNKALFDEVAEHVDEPAGVALSWERLPDKQASRLAAYYDSAPPYDEEALADAVAWAKRTFLVLHSTYDSELRTRAAALRADAGTAAGAPSG